MDVGVFDLEVDKKKTNWTGLVVKPVITTFVVILSLILRLSWEIQYGASLAGLLWCVFSFSPKWRRVLLTLYLIFAIGVISSVRIQDVVATSEEARELIPDPTLRDTLSIGAGMVIGFVVVGLPLLAVMFVSSEYVLALHAVHGVSRGDAFWVIGSLMMGIHLPWMIVEDGEVTESKPKGVLSWVGGPGVVVIRPGNAVAFERGGRVTRITGAGLVKTKRFERIKGIVDLRSQWDTIEAENVLTKDRVPLTIKYGVGYQIEPKPDADERLESMLKGDGEALTEEIGEVYPVYAATVRKAVFNVTPAGWQLATRMAAESFLRDTVAALDFDEIFELIEDPHEQIAENRRRIHEIEQRVQDKLTQAVLNWGVKIETFDVESIEMPAEARERMLDWWGTDWQRRIMVALAEGEREALIRRARGEQEALRLRGQGQAVAVRTVEEAKVSSIRSMIDRLKEFVMQRDIGAVERFIAIIERLTERMMTDDVIAMRYLEVLETLSSAEGDKTLLLGEERQLLGMGRGGRDSQAGQV